MIYEDLLRVLSQWTKNLKRALKSVCVLSGRYPLQCTIWQFLLRLDWNNYSLSQWKFGSCFCNHSINVISSLPKHIACQGPYNEQIVIYPNSEMHVLQHLGHSALITAMLTSFYVRIVVHPIFYNKAQNFSIRHSNDQKVFNETRQGSALRADIGRGIARLLVTDPISPTHWTRPQRLLSRCAPRSHSIII